jgi:hypothetical protein
MQKWLVNTPAAGFISLAKGNLCLNVMGCKSEIIYDGCRATGPPTCMGTASHPYLNEQFEFAGQGLSALKTMLPDSGPHKGQGECITANAEGLLSTGVCESPLPASQQFSYDSTTQQLAGPGGKCLTASAPAPGPGPSPSPATATLSLGEE